MMPTEEIELAESMSNLQNRLDRIMEDAEERNRTRPMMPCVARLVADGYSPDAALETLQLLCSAIMVEEVKEENLRFALLEFARRFEALDDWISAGGELPREWRREV
jgi:hypothetical protein